MKDPEQDGGPGLAPAAPAAAAASDPCAPTAMGEPAVRPDSQPRLSAVPVDNELRTTAAANDPAANLPASNRQADDLAADDLAGNDPSAHTPAAVPARTESAPPPAVAPAAPPPGPTRRRRDTLRGIAGIAAPPRGLRARVRHLVGDVLARQPRRRRAALAIYALRITVQVVRQWARDRCPQQAASLAFQTTLSIVPAVALSLAVLSATGHLDAESVVGFLANIFVAVSPEVIAATLVEWTGKITFKTLGLAGLVITLSLSFIMFNTIEQVMNDIWRAERRRPLAQKLVVFYAVVTTLPVVLGASLYQASLVGLTQGIGSILVSLVASTTAAFLTYYVLPTTKVHIRAALAGALVSAVLFEAAKYAFGVYVVHIAFAKYAGIYGQVALAPLLLVWIYYSWLVLLLGSEIAYAAQHLNLLERREQRQRMSLEKELMHRVNGTVAARVMVAVAEAYVSRRKVMSRRALADRFDVSDEVIDRIAQRLKDRDLLIEVEGEFAGLMPARPPADIRLSDVMAAFRGDDVLDHAPQVATTKLERVLQAIELATSETTSSLTVEDLAER
jgi:membrane protein